MKNMDIKKDIGEKLRKARKRKGLRQEDVAKKAGINSNYYARVERGEGNPSTETIQKLFEVLEIKAI